MHLQKAEQQSSSLRAARACGKALLFSGILLCFTISGTSAGGLNPSWILASQILRATKLNTNRLEAPEGFRVMDFPSWDRFWIMGYASDSKGSSGTVLLVHGFANNCMRDWIPETGRWLVGQGFAVAAIDLRGHGWSNGLPTFGTAESWDIRAALDWLDEHKYPRPFILAGVSLGAMASQRAAVQDSRVAGAFLVMPPSCGWDAIYAYLKTAAVAPDFLTRAGQFINDAYGWDIIQNGDVRNHPSRPAHSPKILVVMGTDDIYDIRKTRQVWEHWYSAEPARYDVSPRQAPEQSKWFLEAPDMGHSVGFNYYPGVNKNEVGGGPSDPRSFELLGEFLDVVAPKKPHGMQADT